MKTFNKKLIAGAVVATLALSAAGTFAFDRGPREQDPIQRLNYIFTQLELTEEQQTQVAEIIQNVAAEQRDAMRETMQTMRDSETRPTREEMTAFRDSHQQALTQALTDQLNTLLSPNVTEDLVEYLDAHRQMGMEMRGHRDDRMGPGGQKPKGGQVGPQSQTDNGDARP